MQYKNYRAKKKNGKVKIQQAAGVIFLATTRYNVDTGALEPELDALNMAALEQARTALLEELDDLNALIDDVGKMPQGKK